MTIRSIECGHGTAFGFIFSIAPPRSFVKEWPTWDKRGAFAGTSFR